MPRRKKPYIDKNHAVKFNLVHRSQRDPLQADSDAPEHVLQPAASTEVSARREEQQKYGVLYDDNYDYLQHLKDVNDLSNVTLSEPVPSLYQSKLKENSKLMLPSEVFASETETKVGMLNKAAPLRGPQLDWDPDVVAALDEDFDFDDPDNQLEDDFVLKANDGEQGEEYDSCNSDHYEGSEPPALEGEQSDMSGDEDVASDQAQLSDQHSDSTAEDMFAEEETKSRFTQYSMTSSVMKRNEGLTLLDDRFEKVYEEYDDDEIGALDQEDIGGFVSQDSELLNNCLEEFEQKQMRQPEIEIKEKMLGVGEMSCDSDEYEADDEDIIKMVVEEPLERWDCQSILSTYSTLYNHPRTISEPKKPKPIKLTKRAQIPEDVLPTRGLTRKQIEDAFKERSNTNPVFSHRPKEETPEEKKVRKLALKEDRRERREEKKINKQAFKTEKIQQEKEKQNVKKNQKGIKLQ